MSSRRDNPNYFRACLIIVACEVAERIAFYAISSNLTVYLITVMQESVADAAKNFTNWGGTTCLTPFIGAFLADAFLGRYWTIMCSLVIYFVALVLVTVSMSFEPFKPHCDKFTMECEKPTPAQTCFLYGSLYMMALGAGGIKACVTAFSADQFDDNDPIQRKERTSFMNWWWLSISTGIMVSAAFFPWVQQVTDWVWVGVIPTVFVGLVASAFAIARPLYYHKAPSGSAFTSIVQVPAVAFKNRKLQLPEDPRDLCEHAGGRPSFSSPSDYRLQHTTRLRFLDKAAIPTNGGRPFLGPGLDISRSTTCTVTQVEEVKLLLGVLPIWATNLPNSAVFAQAATFFVNQGRTLDRSMGPGFQIPAASLMFTISLTTVVFLPVYDKIFVPLISKYTGNPRGISLLQRIGVGLFFSSVAVTVAGAVENHRLKVAKSHGDILPLPMSVFWLIPQYFLVGLYEVFIVVGKGEFFYLQAPRTLQSLGTALFLSNAAVGYFLSSVLVTMVQIITKATSSQGISWVDDDLSRGHLDYFYWLLAGLNLVFFIIFIYCAKKYKYNYSISLVNRIWTCDNSPSSSPTSPTSRYEGTRQGLQVTSSPSDNKPTRAPIVLIYPDEILLGGGDTAARIETNMV